MGENGGRPVWEREGVGENGVGLFGQGKGWVRMGWAHLGKGRGG